MSDSLSVIDKTTETDRLYYTTKVLRNKKQNKSEFAFFKHFLKTSIFQRGNYQKIDTSDIAQELLSLIVKG